MQADLPNTWGGMGGFDCSPCASCLMAMRCKAVNQRCPKHLCHRIVWSNDEVATVTPGGSIYSISMGCTGASVSVGSGACSVRVSFRGIQSCSISSPTSTGSLWQPCSSSFASVRYPSIASSHPSFLGPSCSKSCLLL